MPKEKMKLFLVPCFVIAEAVTKDQADEAAAKYQTMRNGSVMLLDEELPTVAIKVEHGQEYPHTMKGLFKKGDICPSA